MCQKRKFKKKICSKWCLGTIIETKSSCRSLDVSVHGSRCEDSYVLVPLAPDFPIGVDLGGKEAYGSISLCPKFKYLVHTNMLSRSDAPEFSVGIIRLRKGSLLAGKWA